MRSWYDRDSRRHEINIDYPAALKLRDECEIDLLEAYKSPGMISTIYEHFLDDENLVSALVVLEDITQSGVDEWIKCFGNADDIGKAREALLQAVADFFPEQLRQPTLDAIQQLTMATSISRTDCFTLVSGSPIHGNGANDYSDALDTTETNSA